MTTPAEPAIKSYFFGKGYKDLGATIADSWRRNWQSAGEHFNKVGQHVQRDETPMAVIWGTAGVSVVLFGTALFLLASAVHIVVLLAFFLLIYLGFTLVFLTERGFLLCKGFFTVCPECHSKNPLPEYFCPKCRAVHRKLVPSSYGILHHTCKCGQKLPATFFMNRGELASRCPDCEQLLDRAHAEARKAFVPIVGGPAVGKSAYLFSTVQKFVDEEAPHLGFSTFFLEKRTADEYQKIQQDLENGRAPGKTLATLPRALNLKLEKKNSSTWLLYFYDPAGEAFAESEGLQLHKYQEYLSGLVFLVDPFSIPAVLDEYHDRLAAVKKDLNPSSLPIEDALARILLSLEQHFGLGKTSLVKEPVAVVVNKVDAFDLEDRIGERAVAARLAASAGPTDIDTVRNDLLRRQLIDWEQGDFVQQLENRFKTVRYFTCSSLGRMPDMSHKSFEARRVLEPLMWILGSTSSAFARKLRKAA